ncbi:MAG TPA: GNAT family N-acetyltransferase [Acidobacteriaceae bacterium]|jgi:GNAT superfamily N-acetyltransferase|nr:GNAT family N-acetyltransferase [Acidobacteriaceae bacterium]
MPESQAAITIQPVTAADAAGLASMRILLQEYMEYLIPTLGPEHVCVEGFEHDLACLPAEYAPPAGTLLMAVCDGQPAGCVGVRSIQLADGQTVGEVRRMWVRPAFRSRAIGAALVCAAMDAAKRMGHASLYLDTIPEKMPHAYRLYRKLGFQDHPRYNNNPTPGVAFLRIDLPGRP